MEKGQAETGTDILNLAVEFCNFVSNFKCASHLQKTCEISGLLTHSGDDFTLLSVRSTQLITWFFSRHKCFTSTNPNFKYHSESQSF